jgi:sulfotransferase family protein
MNDDMLSPQSFSVEPARRDRITAISSAVQRRPVVLVLGMHRSGTSLCSHILSALGVDMADKIPGPGNPAPTPDNPQGHWERWEIVEFHDRILGLFNRDFSGRFHDFALPVAWWADPRVAEIRREIVGFLEKRMGEGYFGFKDPRTVRLMPVWHQIFNELKLAPKIVLCLRNPAQIGRSLSARDHLDPEIGEYRWLVHMVDFFRYTNKYDICTIEYEEWFRKPLANVEKLQKFLDLPWQQSEDDLALVLSGIIDPAARHDDPSHPEPGQPQVRRLYELARRLGHDGVREEIASIVSRFVGFQQLQRPFIAGFEDIAKTAVKYSEIAREAASLRTVVGERDADLAAADARAAAAEGRLAEAQAEIEAQRGQIAELASERDQAGGLKMMLAEREATSAELSRQVDELAGALEAARGEAAAREAALRCTEEEALQAGSAAAAMQNEIATLRDTLAQAERVEQERTATVGKLEAELEALRETLARTKRERAVAAASVQSEIMSLRDALAQAERKVQQHMTAAAALQGEVVTLQETLAAAREVGKAALAAFRIDTAALVKPLGPRGWRHAIAQFFGAPSNF